jgi:hypothetical protein
MLSEAALAPGRTDPESGACPGGAEVDICRPRARRSSLQTASPVDVEKSSRRSETRAADGPARYLGARPSPGRKPDLAATIAASAALRFGDLSSSAESRAGPPA